MTAVNLGDLARQFASETSELLNKTVTNGVRVSSIRTHSGEVLNGVGVTKTRGIPKPIPISPSATKPAVYLFLVQTYSLDKESRFLANSSSTMSLYTSEEMADDHLIVGLDYVRNPSNEYAPAHLHVAGHRDDLDTIYLGDKRKTRKLRDLHMPVGGRRYRPTLEDLIEFTVTEEMVEPRSGWKETIAKHRASWETIQLKAAVRRNQDDAAEALSNEGWTVTPPDPDAQTS